MAGAATAVSGGEGSRGKQRPGRGKAPPPEIEPMGGEHLNAITGNEGVNHGLSPQTIAWLYLVLLTTAIWLICIGTGVYYNTGWNPSKGEVPLIWFDRLVRSFGPAMPLPILAARWYATLPRERTPAMAASALRPATYTFSALGFLYAGLSVGRAGLYALHSLLAPLLVSAKDGQRHAHLVSDHILLGASLVAILSAEAHVILHDMRHSWSLRSRLDRMVLTAALAVTAVLFTLICAEMHITARYFHAGSESMAALAMGLVALQIPGVVLVVRAGE